MTNSNIVHLYHNDYKHFGEKRLVIGKSAHFLPLWPVFAFSAVPLFNEG